MTKSGKSKLRINASKDSVIATEGAILKIVTGRVTGKSKARVASRTSLSLIIRPGKMTAINTFLLPVTVIIFTSLAPPVEAPCIQ